MKHLIFLFLIGSLLISCSNKKPGVLGELAVISKNQLDKLTLIKGNIEEAEQDYDIIRWSRQTKALKVFQTESNNQFRKSLKDSKFVIPFEQISKKNKFKVQSIQLIELTVNDSAILAVFSAEIQLHEDSLENQNWLLKNQQNELLSNELFVVDSSKMENQTGAKYLTACTSNINSIYFISKIQIP